MLQATGVGVQLDGEGVLDDVSFAVSAGEWLGVVGPNGAGKSTLLRVVAGLCRHDGRVVIDGREVATLRTRELARQVAMVMQTPVVPTGITVVDYVLLGRAAHLGVLQRDGRRDRRIVADVIDSLELSGFVGRRLETLSGGERQRVFLARALAQQPRLLLLDEPTAALDLGHQQDVLGLVDRLRRDQGLTVISTLHDLTLLGEYTDRVLLLHHGRVERHGHPTEVITTDVIHRVYGASVEVVPPDPAAGRLGPAVIPLRTGRR